MILPGIAALAAGLGLCGAAPPPAAAAAAPSDAAVAIAELKLDESRRNAARSRLEAMGTAVVPELLAHAEDPDFTTRWEVVNLLGYLRDKRATGKLVERVLGDENPHVRWRSLWAITSVGDPRSRELFRAALASTEEGTAAAFARWNAAVGLSVLEDPIAVPALHAGVKSPDAWVRWEAVNALGKVHDEHTSALLLEAAASAGAELRREIALTHGRIRDAAAVRALVAALGDPDQGVRWRAAMGLARTTDRSALAAIEARLTVETDAETRKYLEDARRELAR